MLVVEVEVVMVCMAVMMLSELFAHPMVSVPVAVTPRRLHRHRHRLLLQVQQVQQVLQVLRPLLVLLSLAHLVLLHRRPCPKQPWLAHLPTPPRHHRLHVHLSVHMHPVVQLLLLQ